MADNTDEMLVTGVIPPHEKGWRSTSDEVWGRPGICLECRHDWPCDVAILQAQNAALSKRADLLDTLRDEAFPNDPFMSGALRSEIERIEAAAAAPTETDRG